MAEFSKGLNLQDIEGHLDTKFIARKIYYFDRIDSTNLKAKEIGGEEVEGTIVLAEEQIGGRGRLGRTWASPRGKGLYLSIILKPDISPDKLSQITLIAAAALCKALEDMGMEGKIKWPNDIILGNRKVCGILTEIAFKSNKINHCIMGIGINVNLDRGDIPEELRDKAGSLKIFTGKEIKREELLGRVLNHFERLYLPFKEEREISKSIEISRKHSLLIGRNVRIRGESKEEIGEVLDINEKGELVVKFKDSRIEAIFSGEVSIRGIDGYI